jgi:DNA-binding NarL/FixJ family response regulator
LSEASRCTIVLAEDHAVARSGLEFLLSREPGFQIVGSACDGDEALSLVGELEPDVLILDLMLPRKNGSLVLEELSRRDIRPRVLMLSGQMTGRDCERLLELGAEAIASKEDPTEELIEALSALRDGRKFLSTTVRELLGPLDGSISQDGTPLTAREREVLALVAEGHSSAQIGSRLGIATKTAKKHRENIREKLGISSVAEATRVAARLGLTKLS